MDSLVRNGEHDLKNSEGGLKVLVCRLLCLLRVEISKGDIVWRCLDSQRYKVCYASETSTITPYRRGFGLPSDRCLNVPTRLV